MEYFSSLTAWHYLLGFFFIFAGIVGFRLLQQKKRRAKKLQKVLKRHGVLENQQRFQN